MKRFVQTYFMCFVILSMFFFLGGFQLFYFSRHPFRTAASIAFILTIMLCVWMGQEERMEEMEKRVKELEEKLSDAEAEVKTEE